MAPSNDNSLPATSAQSEVTRVPSASAPPTDSSTNTRRQRGSTNASTTSGRIRSASIKLMEANPPPGMWAATGTTASKAPSIKDIRTGSFGTAGWNEETQRQRAGSRTSEEERVVPPRRKSSGVMPSEGTEPFPAVTEEETHERPLVPVEEQVSRIDEHKKHGDMAIELKQSPSVTDNSNQTTPKKGYTSSGEYANGYIPPPKLPWKQSFMIGLKGFWKWFITPSGFLITLYGLNIVAWGGMLFLLLCNAAPAMCTPDCDDINSPRRKWVEYDSQILNSLFCVTGFGLAPWRFRDVYWWICWRTGHAQRSETGIRRLAGIHRGWFRLPGSEQLPELTDAKSADAEDPAVPIPANSIPDPPPTGIRAAPTKGWKMDFVVWNNVGNTFFQIVLCFYMWHYNRVTRPSWATGLFVALGSIVAGIAGIMMWHEGKNIKKVEGVPVRKESADSTDVERNSAHDIPLASNSGTTAKS